MNADSAAVPQIPPLPTAEVDGAPGREPGFANGGIGACICRRLQQDADGEAL